MTGVHHYHPLASDLVVVAVVGIVGCFRLTCIAVVVFRKCKQGNEIHQSSIPVRRFIKPIFGR